jgi:hypothetical protein
MLVRLPLVLLCGDSERLDPKAKESSIHQPLYFLILIIDLPKEKKGFFAATVAWLEEKKERFGLTRLNIEPKL